MARKTRGSDGVPVSAERKHLAKVIGQRLKEAREYANYTQNDAAKLLGYRNSSKLAKIENGTDTSSVPLWLILDAARLYQVSIDFIFGDCSDWEHGAKAVIERDMSRWMFEYRRKSDERFMEAMKKLHHRVYTVKQMSDVIDQASEELIAAMRRFIELNPAFEEEMKGGNRMVSAATKIRNASIEAQDRMRKFGMERKKIEAEVPEIGMLELTFYMDK
ncbi:MAG: helix-turn-helix domain-containing protein [Anaerolineae bacterium]|nr:helix-turn-helix domain-containing protein [Anaerolineae bacterium]